MFSTMNRMPREVATGRRDGLRAGVLSQKGSRQMARTTRPDPMMPMVLGRYFKAWYEERKYHSGLTPTGVLKGSAFSCSGNG